MSSEFLFTSESVSEGHPDKVADQISDAVLDACIAGDPMSRVAAETLCTTGLVVLAATIPNTASIIAAAQLSSVTTSSLKTLPKASITRWMTSSISAPATKV